MSPAPRSRHRMWHQCLIRWAPATWAKLPSRVAQASHALAAAAQRAGPSMLRPVRAISILARLRSLERKDPLEFLPGVADLHFAQALWGRDVAWERVAAVLWHC